MSPNSAPEPAVTTNKTVKNCTLCEKNWVPLSFDIRKVSHSNREGADDVDISVYYVRYNIAAFSLPLDELQSRYLMPHSQVTVAVIFRDQGKEGIHVTGPQVYGNQACQALHISTQAITTLTSP